MLFLYHSTTSVCAIKVRLTLDEKGLGYDGKLLNLREDEQHRPDYVRLNPNHVVPTLLHDDKVIIESTLIIEYLDETFADPPLMPADPYGRAVARLWMKKVDDYLHAACSTLTFAIVFPPVFRKKTKADREAYYTATPYVFRLEMLGLDKLWIGKRPRVEDWCARIRQRPSFARAITGWLTDTDRTRFAALSEDPFPKIAAMVGGQ